MTAPRPFSLNARTLAVSVAAITCLATMTFSGMVGAEGETRTISFYHIHTNETLTVTYKKDGHFIPEAMQKINWIMRDWRENESIAIDPETIDLAWEMHNELGSREPINIICGYRSRDTNEMLRKTRGGQASQSQHITGRAIDITFPDIPLRQLRYSAMIRERGGVGYYPTSALPFVHIDTSRVRAWPRMVRDELALLFPSGHTKHAPAEGGELTPDDSRRARARNPQLAQQVAAYYDLRRMPKTPILVADAGGAIVKAPEPKLAQRPQPTSPERLPWSADVAALEPAPQAPVAEKLKLDAQPKLVERSSTFTAAPSNYDRSQLDQLVTLASLEPPQPSTQPKLIASPQPVTKPIMASMSPKWGLGGPPVAATAPAATRAPITGPAPAAPPKALTALQSRIDTRTAALPNAQVKPAAKTAALESNMLAARFSGQMNWVTAPEFDEDHPEELSYQPFPVGAAADRDGFRR